MPWANWSLSIRSVGAREETESMEEGGRRQLLDPDLVAKLSSLLLQAAGYDQVSGLPVYLFNAECDLITFFSHTIGPDNFGLAENGHRLAGQVDLQLDSVVVGGLVRKEGQHAAAAEINTVTGKFPRLVLYLPGAGLVTGPYRCADHDPKVFTQRFRADRFKGGKAQHAVTIGFFKSYIQINGPIPVFNDEAAVCAVFKLIELKKFGWEEQLEPRSFRFFEKAVQPLDFPGFTGDIYCCRCIVVELIYYFCDSGHNDTMSKKLAGKFFNTTLLYQIEKKIQ